MTVPPADIAQDNDISESEWVAIDQPKANAMSTDCGKDYVPKAEVDNLKAVCAELRDTLIAIGQCPACGGEGVIHPECQSCLSGEPERCTCANEPAQECPVCLGSEKAIYDKVKHALSTDCGKDYVSKEQVKPLTGALREIVEWVESAEKEWLESVDISAPKGLAEEALARAKEMGL